MPIKKGQYLGGVRSVEDLRKRCVVDTDTGCWHWKQCFHQGSPRVIMPHPTTGKIVHMRGRRAALVLQRGRDLPAGHKAWRRDCCESDDCVNPAHARSGTRLQWSAWARREGVYDTQAKRIAMRRLAEKRTRVLDEAKRREIVESSESTYALAKRYGCSQFAVWRVRAGQDRTGQLLPGASVFSWRP